MMNSFKEKMLFIRIWNIGREAVAALLFPARCPVCDDILSPEENSIGIHSECESKLYPIYGAVCMHCGRPFRKNLRRYPEKDKDEYFDNSIKEFCQECIKRSYVHGMRQGDYKNRSKASASPILMGKALYLYKDEIKQTMYRFKYSNKREYAKFFAQEAVRRYPQLFDADAIIPVPMYLPKKRKRGYNQAESFAKALSAITAIPVNTRLIQRIKDTKPQKELNDIERKNNLKNAFQKGKNIVEYNKIVLVDDIYTTGSTVETVAEELKSIGIHQIYVLSICIGGEM